jgi:hypothetical protein
MLDLIKYGFGRKVVGDESPTTTFDYSR